MNLRMWGLLLLGCSQGAIGWWMVKSGINKKPEYLNSPSVSTYRLIVHNGMALSIYAGLIYHYFVLSKQNLSPQVIAKTFENVPKFYFYSFIFFFHIFSYSHSNFRFRFFQICQNNRKQNNQNINKICYTGQFNISPNPLKLKIATQIKLRRYSFFLLLFLSFNLVSGASVAGIQAGKVFNTWPLMNGAVVPSDYWKEKLSWRNCFENKSTVQCNHRMFAYWTLAFVVLNYIRFKRFHSLTDTVKYFISYL